MTSYGRFVQLANTAGLLLAVAGCAARTSVGAGAAANDASGGGDALPASASATLRDPAAPVAPAEYSSTLVTRRQRLIERGLRLGAEDVGYYMDVQEARLRQAGGTALRLTRRGASVILELPGHLNFEVGRARLSPAALTALAGVATVLVDYRLTIISVEGHTDDSGDAAQNRTLSEQRASAVARQLTSKGVEVERLVVVGHGADRPVADNSTEVGREANRRVVLRVDPLQR